MLDPLTAADVLADLGFILAPVAGSIGGVLTKERGASLGSLLDGVKGEGEEGAGLGEGSSIDVAFEKAVLGFFERFSKEKQREIIALMSKQTTVLMSDGKEPQLPTIFSMHFRGRLKSMYRWLVFAMRVQFKDFFDGWGTDMSAVLAQMGKATDQA